MSITRSFVITEENFEKIQLIAKVNDLSYSQVIRRCIEAMEVTEYGKICTVSKPNI